MKSNSTSYISCLQRVRRATRLVSHTEPVMLSDAPYVRVFSLDFSKAFDTVRHATLMEKLSTLAVPDEVYNWIKDFLEGHSHCTKFGLDVSPFADITASVIQGSSLGPSKPLEIEA